MNAIKVVRKTADNRRVSTVRYDETCVEYIPYEHVEPHKGFGPLCVFRNLSSAEKFIDMYCDCSVFEIWHCKIRKSRRKTIRRDIHIRTLPQGTIFASKVKLTKLIEQIDLRRL